MVSSEGNSTEAPATHTSGSNTFSGDGNAAVAVGAGGEQQQQQQVPAGERRVFVITGATRGMGRSLALELARRGHLIGACGTNSGAVEKMQAELGDNHLVMVTDVSSDESVASFARAVKDKLGAPHFVVNNAGTISEGSARVWEIPAQEFRRVMAVNVEGQANVIRHFVPLLLAAGRGVIVNISSAWGRTGGEKVGAYCASKWAVEGLTKALARDLPPSASSAGSSLFTIALHPGVIATDMLVTVFGAAAVPLYPTPDEWAPQAADFILRLQPSDNGASLTVS